MHPAGSFTSNPVIQQLHQLIEWGGKPESIRVDNGPEFIAERLKSFCKYYHIELDFITPGKTTENALIGRFNKTERQGVLNIKYYPTLIDAKKILEQWQYDDNNNRLNSRINNMISTIYFTVKFGKLYNSLLQAEFITFQQRHNNYTFFIKFEMFFL
jgi:putative transposase